MIHYLQLKNKFCIYKILTQNEILLFYVNNRINPTTDALREIPIQA